jgi:hypothetical protein
VPTWVRFGWKLLREVDQISTEFNTGAVFHQEVIHQEQKVSLRLTRAIEQLSQ